MNVSVNTTNSDHFSKEIRYHLKKIDHTKSKILFSIGDDNQIPQLDDLEDFFHSKLDVTTSRIDSIVLDAKVCRIEAGNIIVDMNLKNYGKLSKDEMRIGLKPVDVNVGDVIQVVAESIDAKGYQYIRVSWEKARRLTLWSTFEEYKNNKTVVYGAILGETRGGYTANIQGVKVFIPGSHLDFRPPERGMLDGLKEAEQPFIILSMERDDKKDNIVVSRREVLNGERMKVKDVAIAQIKIGDVLKGIVKSIAPYGCFVNLKIPGMESNVDGLLHINDISWSKITHPSEMIQIGDEIEVLVINLIPEERKISLGMKQLQANPWKDLIAKLKVGDKIRGVIKNTTDYGVFVEIENGIEGLVHVSEISWNKKGSHLSVGQETDAVILAIDEEKTRISLSIKQCTENPWEKFAQAHKPGSVIPVFVRKITDFGIFADLGNDIEGLIHISDVSWENDAQRIMSRIKVGSDINVKILSIDAEKGRVVLGLKQLIKDYFEEFLARVKEGDTIKNCIIFGSWNEKLEIEIPETRSIVTIDIENLPSNYNEERQGLCAKGNTIDSRILSVDRENRKIILTARSEDDQPKVVKTEEENGAK
jgi:small subunit ribosomal protein S1